MFKLLTLTALAALSLAQGGLPTCAEAPAISYLTGTSCGLNFQCICGNAAILNGLIPIVQKACPNPSDQQAALQFASSQCESFGINISTELSTGSASAAPATSAPSSSVVMASSSAPASSSAMTSSVAPSSAASSSSSAAAVGAASSSTVTSYTTIYPSCSSSMTLGGAMSSSYVSPTPTPSSMSTPSSSSVMSASSGPATGGAVAVKGNAIVGLVALIGVFAI